MKKRLPLACLFALVPLLPFAASANIIPSNTTITGAGPFVWTYNLQLSRDQDVHSGLPPAEPTVPHQNLSFGSFLTIFDFVGYVDGSCTSPDGWSCTSQNLGFTPDDVLPSDDAAIPNVTWVYTTGRTLTGFPDGRDLGMFTATSLYSEGELTSYAARGVKNSGESEGTIADNVGNVNGPRPSRAVPEPGSLALAGLALLMLGGVNKQAKSRRAIGATPA